jgi:hypothetical protein
MRLPLIGCIGSAAVNRWEKGEDGKRDILGDEEGHSWIGWGGIILSDRTKLVEKDCRGEGA